MGYNTTFDGKFTITPPLKEELVSHLNDESCIDEYHDWKFSKDGSTVGWNGAEKSYDMPEKIRKLWKNFFPNHKLSGTIYASGEEAQDIWKMVADGKQVTVVYLQREW